MKILTIALSAALVTAPVVAQEQSEQAQSQSRTESKKQNDQASAQDSTREQKQAQSRSPNQNQARQAPNPYARPDDSWISVDGIVSSVGPDTFVLNYGAGMITVEMDDGDRDADAYNLLIGDKVRVTGVIDDDFLEMRTIEASSVYVENLGTYFYASAVDEEDTFVTYVAPVTVAAAVVQGTVKEVSSEEFVVDTGTREIRVEVDEMAVNPLDGDGYQRIRVGDRVSVAGRLDTDLLEGETELVASSVVTLRANGRQASIN